MHPNPATVIPTPPPGRHITRRDDPGASSELFMLDRYSGRVLFFDDADMVHIRDQKDDRVWWPPITLAQLTRQVWGWVSEQYYLKNGQLRRCHPWERDIRDIMDALRERGGPLGGGLNAFPEAAGGGAGVAWGEIAVVK